MLVRRLIATCGRTGGALAFAGLVAGCAGAGTPQGGAAPAGEAQQSAVSSARSAANGLGVRRQQPSRVRGWMARDAKGAKAAFYWGSYDDSTVDVLSSKGTVLGTISDGLSDPERLFVDKKKNMYASNAGNSTITEYAPNATSPSLTISDGVSTPTGLVVGGDGTVYVANVGSDSVTEYPAGSTSPSLTIALTVLPENLAVDKSNNLYIQYLGGNTGSGVIEVPSGQSSGTDLGLTIGSAGALEVDKKGNILILDTSVPALDVFPPKTTSPSKQIDITSGSPFELSLNKKETQLYVSVSSGASFIIQAMKYPKGSSFSSKFTGNDGDWPIAATPDNAL